MKLPPFAFRRATSLDEALAVLAEAGDEAKVLAGGQSLVPAMAFRLVRPALLVDVNDIPGLDTIERENGTLALGALVRHAALERAPSLDGPWVALREAVAHVGHYPIRVRGTFGGSIAHADPAAELCVVAVALDAEILVRSAAGERSIPAEAFFVGPYMTALAADEVVVGVRFSGIPAGAPAAFEEFAERSGDFALASSCAAVALRDGRVEWARVALGSVGPVPLRAHDAEASLVGSDASDEAIEEAAHAASLACDPGTDSHATADYRRHLVTVLVRRALRRIREGAPA